MDTSQLHALLKELTALPHETEWVEFKHNKAEPEEIGEYISALANSAALHEKDAGYLVWGIEDGTHKVVGTAFKPKTTKVGNEELENRLARLLTPRLDFKIHEFDFDGLPMVMFEIQPAANTPVRFKEMEFIRIGTVKKKLKEHPEKERALWMLFSQTPFEVDFAARNVSSDDVLSLIDYPAFFDMLGLRLPDNRAGILERLKTENVIREKGGRYDVTNLGAVIFAKNLKSFGGLRRKGIRVVHYQGKGRIETIREQEFTRGYGIGFEEVITYINNRLPGNEEIGQAFRREVRTYPEIAIRELVANMMIHQDFTLRGTSLLVEIFDDRIEFTSPGEPLIDTLRFIDIPPQSRNEDLASFMRRLEICEERGSGIDKVIFQIELFQLPPPDFTVPPGHTKAVLYAPRKLSQMDRKEKIRACYQHACLRYVMSEQMTNSSLRERFSIKDKSAATASRIIADTIESELIRPFDPENTSRKHARYVPIWA